MAADGAIEHPARGDTIDVGGFDTEADDAAAENVHDQHYPMAAQEDRFAAEENDAPEAIFRVGDECQPRRAVGSGVVWPIVLRKDAANDIFVDLDAERMSDLLGDPVWPKYWSGFPAQLLTPLLDGDTGGARRP